MKNCKYCKTEMNKSLKFCPKCGRQVEELKKSGNDQIIINNNNSASAAASASAVAAGGLMARPKDKIVALLLCIFLGWFGAHKFYEGKIGLGIIYLFTFGLFGVGVIIDFIVLIFKPNPYYV